MTSRWSALLVWGLAAAAAVFWALRLLVPSPPVPANALLADNGVLLAGDLTRLLGAPPVKLPDAVPAQPEASSRFKLTGVVATGASRDTDPARPPSPGVAIVSVDGKPPQAFRVGDGLDQQWVLQSVGLRSARIGMSGGAPGFVLELPPPTPPTTGVPAGLAGVGVPPSGMPAPGFAPPQQPPMQGVPPSGMPVPGPVMQQMPMNQGSPSPALQPPAMPAPGGPNTQNRSQIQ